MKPRGSRLRSPSRSRAPLVGLAGIAAGTLLACRCRRRAVREVSRIVDSDPLTRGMSFSRFCMEAGSTFSRAQAGEYALLIFDISRFRCFNGSFGYAEGDRLIVALDQLLDRFDRPGEMHARMYSDRFAVLLRWSGIQDFAERFTCFDADVNGLEMLKGRRFRVICLGGLAVFDDLSERGATSVAALADCALYARERVDESSRSTFALYTQAMKEQDIARRVLQGVAADALANGEFVPYYQPKVALDTGKVVGFEALARWRVSQDEVLLPGEFIEPLESNGLITEVDFAMLRQACAFLRGRIDAGLPVVPIACNFSRLNLRDERFAAAIKDTVASYGVPCDLLELELTESVVMENLPRAVAVGNDFKEQGFRLSIDDFGSGYSSLGTLQELPADVLKIDRSLLMGSQQGTRSRIVLESVVAMANRLGVSVVVEGVETPDQADMLKALDPGIVVQGFLCSPPVPEDEAATMLDSACRKGTGFGIVPA